MKNLLLLNNFADQDINLLISKFKNKYNIFLSNKLSNTDLKETINKTQVIIGNKISKSLLSYAKKLELFLYYGSGIENLNLNLFNNLNIKLCSSKSHSSVIAEFAFCMGLSLIKKISLHHNMVKNQKWYSPKYFKNNLFFQSRMLNELKIGLIGYGKINQLLEKILKNFNSDIFIFAKNKNLNRNIKSLNYIFENCNLIFLALPLTKQTHGVVSEKIFKKSKNGFYLVNISRAEVINKSALIKALRNNTILGFATDCPYKTEKKDYYKDFLKFENVILSPHRSSTLYNNNKILDDIFYNLNTHIKFKKYRNLINIKKGY